MRSGIIARPTRAAGPHMFLSVAVVLEVSTGLVV